MRGMESAARGFDAVATSLHLHEYTLPELHPMLTQLCFTHTQIISPKDNGRVLPASPESNAAEKPRR